MSKQFTPCPACGAVGEIGEKCLFCGTAIMPKKGSVISETRIVKERTINPQQFAEKISIYHNVRGSASPQLMYASIGDEIGIINLNAEIVYPLQHEYSITIISDSIIFLNNFKDENRIYARSGREIRLGTLLNLATMDRRDGIECTSDGHYYEWKALRCNGEIDSINWTIISRPLLDRTALAMPYFEYKDYKEKVDAHKKVYEAKKKAEWEAEVEAEFAARREAIRRTQYGGLWIFPVIGVILYVLWLMFS